MRKSSLLLSFKKEGPAQRKPAAERKKRKTLLF